MSWWQDAITQAFNPPVEPGIDVGTPFHTPITALAPGKVISETFGGFGARVDVQTGPTTVEYYQHLDTIAGGLNVGSLVQAGQQLGLSGGQLSGGSRPNSSANSSGPHVEFGVINSGKPVDPAAVLSAGIAGIGGVAGAGSQAAKSAGGGLVNVNFPDPIGSLRDWLTSPFKATGGAIATSEGFVQSNIIPLVVAGLIILVVLGTGQKTAQAPAPQIVPIPV